MSSLSPNYSSSLHRGSLYSNSCQPPPPPPKPTVTHEISHSPSLGIQSASSMTLDEQYCGGTSLKVAQTTEYGESDDPGERWLPRILENKSKQQLAEILDKTKLLNALAHSTTTSHPSVLAGHSPLEAALKENIALASYLNKVEAHLTQLRSSTQAQLISTHALERLWRQKQTEMDQALAPFAPPSLYQKLNQAILDQEQTCGTLEETFLEGDGVAMEREVTEWVRRFRESRKVYYSRQAKKERWDEGRIGGWR